MPIRINRILRPLSWQSPCSTAYAPVLRSFSSRRDFSQIAIRQRRAIRRRSASSQPQPIVRRHFGEKRPYHQRPRATAAAAAYCRPSYSPLFDRSSLPLRTRRSLLLRQPLSLAADELPTQGIIRPVTVPDGMRRQTPSRPQVMISCDQRMHQRQTPRSAGSTTSRSRIPAPKHQHDQRDQCPVYDRRPRAAIFATETRKDASAVSGCHQAFHPSAGNDGESLPHASMIDSEVFLGCYHQRHRRGTDQFKPSTTSHRAATICLRPN